MTTEDAALADLRAALRDDVRLEIISTVNLTRGTLVRGVQVFRPETTPKGRRRWVKAIPHTIYPADDQTVSDVLDLIANMMREEANGG